MNNKLLDVENLTMKFGGLVAIDDLTFSASKNQITSIIGPNGAGKTTVFNCLTGFYKATAGSMYLNKEKERLNLRKKVFENDENFSIIEVKENKIPHTFINKRYLKSIA